MTIIEEHKDEHLDEDSDSKSVGGNWPNIHTNPMYNSSRVNSNRTLNK